MKNIRVITLEDINVEELTDIWNRCWYGYYYDMTYTPEHIRAWLYLSQVSLQHSSAIVVEDHVAGFALLSVDGIEGWIAGACVDPEFRRKGLFTPLMHYQLNLATGVGLKRVYLEVWEQNHALKVYQSVGFKQVRQLNIYRPTCKIGPQPDRKISASPLETVSVEQYYENRRRASFNPAWQRKDEYLKRHGNSLAVMNITGTAGALLARDRFAPCLDAWSANATGAEEVITSLLERSNAPFSLINQPQDVIVDFLSSSGINPSAKQFEMCAELS